LILTLICRSPMSPPCRAVLSFDASALPYPHLHLLQPNGGGRFVQPTKGRRRGHHAKVEDPVEALAEGAVLEEG
jgi:hypothetical protein